MADINTTYVPADFSVDKQELDRALRLVWGGLINAYYRSDDYKQLIAQIDQLNADDKSTADGVKVAYTGSTSAERVQWLNDRITAIDKRVAFIKIQLNGAIDDLGSDPVKTTVTTALTAASAIPVIGTVFSLFASTVKQDELTYQYRTQTKVQAYLADVNQLATIRAKLVTELGATPLTTYTAPTPIPTWVYYAGAALLVLLFVYLYRRNHKRRKR